MSEPRIAENRALILAASGRDAQITQAILTEAGLSSHICATIEALCRELQVGAALVITTEESLARADIRDLSAWLSAQPPWSDFPFVVLTQRGGGLDRNPAAMRLMNLLGNVSFLERPLHPVTLVSVVGTALRARKRQYQARDHLLDLERAATELRESADRLAFAQKAGRLGSWEYDVASGALIASDVCKQNFGREPSAEFTYRDLLDAIHADDRERVEAEVKTAFATQSDYDTEYRTVWPDGSVHWVQIRGRVLDAEESANKMVGVSLDITDRKESETRQWLLTAELDHRVKNMLAVIQSLISQTRRRAETLDGFSIALQGRVQAVARTNNLLSQTRWKGASLYRVMLDELEPYRREDEGSVRLNGPDMLIRPKAATALGMAVHELATNAVKYGALSRPQGWIEVSWAFTGASTDRKLGIVWRERGGPLVQPPTHRGFGSLMIERTLAYEVDGVVRLDFDPDGLVCRIDISEDQLIRSEAEQAADLFPDNVLPGPSVGGLLQKRILVVEDSALVAMDVEEVLQELGCEPVGPAASVRQAFEFLSLGSIDGAILDVNLGDDNVFPVADRLAGSKIPFMFATGYDRSTILPARFQHMPTVQKPFETALLKAMVLKTFS